MYALRPGEYVLKFLKIMRLGIYLVLLTTFTVSANGFSQKVKVTLNLEQRSILEIIKELRKVSDYQFLYRVDELRKCGKRDLKVQDAGVEEVMRQLLDGTHLTWRLDDDGTEDGGTCSSPKSENGTGSCVGYQRGKTTRGYGDIERNYAGRCDGCRRKL